MKLHRSCATSDEVPVNFIGEPAVLRGEVRSRCRRRFTCTVLRHTRICHINRQIYIYKQRRRSTNLYQSSFSSSIKLSPSSSSDSESTSTSVSDPSGGAIGVTLFVGDSSSGSPLLNPLIVFYQFRRKLL